MHEVTKILENYREALRHMWNTYYKPLNDAAMQEQFIPFAYWLFECIVVRPIGRPSSGEAIAGNWPFGREYRRDAYRIDGFGVDPIPYLQVRPRYDHRYGLIWLTIDNAASTVIHPEDMLDVTTIDLRFIDIARYQDDFRYYRCRVYAYPDDPTKEGLDVLINAVDVQIFFDESAVRNQA